MLCGKPCTNQQPSRRQMESKKLGLAGVETGQPLNSEQHHFRCYQQVTFVTLLCLPTSGKDVLVWGGT